MEGFYAVKCPGETMPVIIMAAGYRGLPYQDFRWQSHYVQGRGLYRMEAIREKRPDVWAIISAELIPGLDEWADAVSKRGFTNLKRAEQVDAYQALLQCEQRNIFLQDSAVHYPDFSTSHVFVDLPIFHNKVFLEWLQGELRADILQLQSKAELCFKAIVQGFRGRTVLDEARHQLGMVTATTLADSRAVLDKMCQLLLQQPAPIEILPQHPAQTVPEAPALAPGQPGVVAVTSVNALDKLWESWEVGYVGCIPLRCYYADPPYPRDDRSTTLRWWKNKGSERTQRWGSVRRMVLEMDKQVRHASLQVQISHSQPFLWAYWRHSRRRRTRRFLMLWSLHEGWIKTFDGCLIFHGSCV